MRRWTRGAAAALIAVGVAGWCASCVRPLPQGAPITMGPVTAADQVEYVLDIEDAPTVEAARTLTVRMRVDGGAANTGPFDVLMQPVGCEAAVGEAGWRCVAQLPPVVVERLNAPGAHTVRLAGFLAAENPATGHVGEGPGSDPLVFTTAGTPPPAPAAPTDSRFTR